MLAKAPLPFAEALARDSDLVDLVDCAQAIAQALSAIAAWYDAIDEGTVRRSLEHIRAATDDAERRKLSAKLMGELQRPQKIAVEVSPPERQP